MKKFRTAAEQEVGKNIARIFEAFHDRRVVAGLLQRALHGIVVGMPRHRRRVVGEIDVDTFDAGDALQRGFHGRDTAGATHAQDGQADFFRFEHVWLVLTHGSLGLGLARAVGFDARDVIRQ